MTTIPPSPLLTPVEALSKAANARFIAIDGLPVSGKSTLADLMIEGLGAEAIYLDDLVRPEGEWRGRIGPAFPFAYIRYAEFLDTVKTLIMTGECSYFPYDWSTGQISTQPRHLTAKAPIIVEGVSALHPELAPLYDVTFWVESEASSVLDASTRRGVGDWAEEWRNLFLPSVDLYMATDPKKRADFHVAGRGCFEEALSG